MRNKSLFQNTTCYVCGRQGTETHHIFFGPHRKKSDKWGLTVRLCHEHHEGNSGVHGGNRALDLRLKEEGQRRFEQLYGHEKFMQEFKKNYL